MAFTLLSASGRDEPLLAPLSTSPAALQAEVLPACLWLVRSRYAACRTRTDQDAKPRHQALQCAQGWWGLCCRDRAVTVRVPCHPMQPAGCGSVERAVVACRATNLHRCTLLHKS